MGFELKLIVGEVPRKAETEIQEGPPTFDQESGTVYRPNVKGPRGGLKRTGRKEFVMRTLAELELHNPGVGPIYQLYNKSKNADPKTAYKWWADGNTTIEEDPYGTRRKPVPVSEVVKALEKELKEDTEPQPYRLFVWALDYLKSLQKTEGDKSPELQVFLYGH